MKLVFFGPPGSGKGTQAKLLSKKYKISHLSTGDILREKLKSNDALSIKLREIMTSGNLVSDDILNQIVSQKLNSSDCQNGFILDGYPRTLDQAKFLISFINKHNIKFDKILDFKIDFKIVEERIIDRSKKEKRSDDNIEVVKVRLEKYLNETYPVSEYFSLNFKSIFFSVDASQEISIIQKELEKIIKKAKN